jgi:hypothetical protein
LTLITAAEWKETLITSWWGSLLTYSSTNFNLQRCTAQSSLSFTGPAHISIKQTNFGAGGIIFPTHAINQCSQWGFAAF